MCAFQLFLQLKKETRPKLGTGLVHGWFPIETNLFCYLLTLSPILLQFPTRKKSLKKRQRG